ncbi:hypothetical protein [Brunnivagina elsteri]|nr:hypothetical protein [Calothrix elsteri]
MSIKLSANKYMHRNRKQKPADCYLNPPCACINPGKEIECENCEHLESCLSRCHASSTKLFRI